MIDVGLLLVRAECGRGEEKEEERSEPAVLIVQRPGKGR